MRSGGKDFPRYLTSRKAPFPRFVILANGGQSLPKRMCCKNATTARMFGGYLFTVTTHRFEITGTILIANILLI
jgi:hypothetical protein